MTDPRLLQQLHSYHPQVNLSWISFRREIKCLAETPLGIVPNAYNES